MISKSHDRFNDSYTFSGIPRTWFHLCFHEAAGIYGCNHEDIRAVAITLLML